MYEKTEVFAPAGVNRDMSMYELPPELWSDCANVDFRRDRTNKAQGYNNPWPVISDAVITPNYLLYFTDNVNAYWIYADSDLAATSGTIRITDGLTTAQVGAGYSATPLDKWSGTNFNGVAILTNPNDQPQQSSLVVSRDIDDTVMIPLSDWGTQAGDSTVAPELYLWTDEARCRIMRTYKNYLFAMDNWDKNGRRYPAMVRWSNAAELGDVPKSWDPTSESSQAGLNVLGDTPGKIVDGLTLGDYFMIYKTDSVHAVQFVGGAFNFSFRKVFGDEAGCLGQDCVADFMGNHFVLGTNGAYVHNGASKTDIMEKWVKDAFFNNVDPDYLQDTRVVADHSNHEIWIYFISSGAENQPSNQLYADRAIIWNWDTKKWTLRDLTAPVSYMAEGVVVVQLVDDTWDSDDMPWDTDATIWNSNSDTALNQRAILMGGPNNDPLFYTLTSDPKQNGISVLSYVERKGIDLGSDSAFKYIERIIPHLDGRSTQYPIDVIVYAEDVASGNPESAEGTPYTFTPANDWMVDCHITGRYFGVRFESYNPFQLTGYSIVWKPVGTQ